MIARASKHASRGSALITVMIFTLVLLALVAGTIYYAGRERLHAIRPGRVLARATCAQAGLALARTYFSANYPSWNTFLSTPSTYNPIAASWMSTAGKTPATIDATCAATPATCAAFAAAPQLFFDLDGDGANDVYIYVRDNEDEPFGVAANYQRDNDQNVIVGSICISKTMVPRLEGGQIDTSQLTAESLLSYDLPGSTYTAQAGGAGGNANVNR